MGCKVFVTRDFNNRTRVCGRREGKRLAMEEIGQEQQPEYQQKPYSLLSHSLIHLFTEPRIK